MNNLVKIEDTDIILIDGDRGVNYPSKNEFYDEGYCLFLDARNITDKGFDFSETHFITEEKDEILRNGKLQRNDIVMMTRGSVGNVALYDETVPYDNIRINSGMIIIRCKKGYDSLQVYYLLKSNFVQKQISDMMSGSVQKQLPVSIINKINLLNTEIRIDTIYAIDKKIENNNRINRELDTMAKTIYDYWFLQFEFPNEEGKPYKSSGGKMVWNEELKRKIPEGWEIDTIGKHIDIDRGISYSSDDLEGEGVPLINLSSFNIDATYKPEGLKTYSGTYSKEKVISPFDLVICVTQQTAIDLVGNTDVIGKTFLVPDIFETKDIVASMDVIKIQSDDTYGKYYLNRLINTKFFHRYISGFATGTKIKHLDIKGLLNYKCEIPNEQALKKFNSLMEIFEKKKSEIIAENQELTTLRDFLLPLLMNGQVGFKG